MTKHTKRKGGVNMAGYIPFFRGRGSNDSIGSPLLTYVPPLGYIRWGPHTGFACGFWAYIEKDASRLDIDSRGKGAEFYML